MFGGGYSGVTPFLLTSMFPARVRARSIGFVFHIGACFAAFVPTFIARLAEHNGLTFAQAILVVTGVLQLTLAVALVLRPKNVFDSAVRDDAPAVPLAMTEPI
jgi:MFS transporter, SHS family, lactate transporter